MRTLVAILVITGCDAATNPASPERPPLSTAAPAGANSAASAVLLINSGSSEDYVDSQGRTWSHDTLSSNAPYEGLVDRGSVPIAGTADARIYQTEHYCMSAFDIPIADGTYTVNLHFAETKFAAAGARVFDVDVEGQALAGLDVFSAAGGQNRALVERFDGVRVADGALTIRFTGHVDCPEVNGIEVLAAADTGPAPSPYVPPGYSLVFSDEFNGSAIDTNRWMTQYPCGCTSLNDEIEHYTNDGSNLHVGGGNITIRAEQDLSSGVFTGRASFKYGYFELRAQMRVSKGAWPAYWLTSDSRWPPEWDIFEVVTDPTIVYQTPHLVAGDMANCDTNGVVTGLVDVNDGFHIYGFLWAGNDVTWYIDGHETRHCTVSPGSTADFMWLQHNVAIGGNWPGNPDGTTQWPMELTIDYSRVYQDATGAINIHDATGDLVDPDSPR